MNTPLKIAVADDELDMRDYFRAILPRLGHEVVFAAENGQQLVDYCLKSPPDMVVTDIRMPVLDGIAASTAIYQSRPLPIILVSAFHDPELIQRAEDDHVLAYLVKPIKRADLETAIAIALARFEQFRKLQSETHTLREALEQRKLIERAKGLVMKQSGADEQVAYTRMQRLASENNLKLVEVARSILLAAAANQASSAS